LGFSVGFWSLYKELYFGPGAMRSGEDSGGEGKDTQEEETE